MAALDGLYQPGPLAGTTSGTPANLDPAYYTHPWSGAQTCPHPRSCLRFGMQFPHGTPEGWHMQAVCVRCLARWTQDDVPNRVLGLCWLQMYESNFGTPQETAETSQQVRDSVAAHRQQMLTMIRDLGVDPNVD